MPPLPPVICCRNTASCNLVACILRSDVTHKVSLYADDLLLHISDPHALVPVLFDFLEHYSRMSGYKLNYQKNEEISLHFFFFSFLYDYCFFAVLMIIANFFQI